MIYCYLLLFFSICRGGSIICCFFAMLLNFQRHNKMKGMCQIVAWSVVDEAYHSKSMINLYHDLLNIYSKEVSIKDLHQRNFFSIATKMLSQRHLYWFMLSKFYICWFRGEWHKMYVRYMFQQKLTELGIVNPSYQIINAPTNNPLPWFDTIVYAPSHSNFFEIRPIEYALSSMQGDWTWR